MIQDQLDKIANDYNKTKDPKLKKLWYQKIKEWNNGLDNTERRIVSVSAVNKANDGRYIVIGKSRLL